MQYDIITTLGPSSAAPQDWQALLASGATAFRLNTSHLTLDELSTWVERLESFRTQAGQDALPLVLDLQGSKWRLGDLPPVELIQGQLVELVLARQADRPGVLAVPHVDFFAAAYRSDGQIVLNDARVHLQVERIMAESITARVVQPGPVSGHKGITFRSSDYRSERTSEKDWHIYERTRGLAGVQYALSYVKDGLEMTQYRRQFGAEAVLIAKLERAPAMRDASGIAQSADGLWVCRGDLGAELGLVGMAEAVTGYTQSIKRVGKPSVMAGQVFEHMTAHSTPTRSEVCYLLDTLQAGYCGVVLSDETAIGINPAAACQAAALWRF